MVGRAGADRSKMVKKEQKIRVASLKILAMYNHILVELPANFSKVFCSQ